jgi:hypothetical protein
MAMKSWFALAVFLTLMSPIRSEEVGEWSGSVNGLQARLILVEKPKFPGVRWMVPYLELRNASDVGNPMEVRCGGGRERENLKVELLDAAGTPITEPGFIARSGPTPYVGTLYLPWDSVIRFSLECTNWNGPAPGTTAIHTNSWAWSIRPAQKGRVFLRATLRVEKPDPLYRGWVGALATPPLKVDWSEEK